MFNSLKWISAASLLTKLIGLLSLPILARLLTPTDFGVVALASTIVYLGDIFSESGAQKYITATKRVDWQDIYSAWSLNIVLKGGTVLVLIIGTLSLSPILSSEIVAAVIIVAIGLVFQSLMSPKLLLCKKHLIFGVVAKITVLQKVCSFTTTIVLAILLESYMAMVLGVLVHFVTGCLLSYVFLPAKVKLDFSRYQQQIQFSKLIYAQSIIGYVRSEVDILIGSAFYSFSHVGGYSTTKEISTLPGRDIISPLTEPVLAMFAKTSTVVKQHQQLEKVLIIFSFFATPIAIYLAIYANEVIAVVLGEQWLGYSLLLSIFSIIVWQYAQYAVFEEYFIAQGYLHILFKFEAILTAILIFLLIVTALTADIYVFAATRSGFAVCSIVLLWWLLFKVEKFNGLKLVSYNVLAGLVSLGSYFCTLSIPTESLWLFLHAGTYYGLYIIGLCMALYLRNYLQKHQLTENPLKNFKKLETLKKSVIEYEF